MDLSAKIRDVSDFPRKGILFKDITTLLADKAAFRHTIDRLAEHYGSAGIDLVVATEARGFIFGAPLAYKLECGFVPVRKPGKLPIETVSIEYTLEYGSNVLEIHRDAIKPGQKVLVVDDLLATGGTAAATVKLVEKLGGHIVGVAFVIELTDLNGKSELGEHEIMSLIQM